MTQILTRVTGVGSYLPDRIVTNDELAKSVDTNDAWIRERTGIKRRHIAAEGETTVDMGEAAARRALDHAGMDASDIDLIIVATTTPDLVFPSSAAMIQGRLGIRIGAAFDVQAVCSGFIYGMSIADGLIQLGQHRNALVIGSETMSRIIDWTDRSTCVLFGDGAGAFVLEGRAIVPDETDPRRLIGSYLRADGSFLELLRTTGGISSTQSSGLLTMQGNSVYRHAVTKISEAMSTLMQKHGVTSEDIDWFVPHQANQRILEGVSKRMGIDAAKVISTVAEQGNTSAASVPLAFDQGVRDGRIKRGELCLLEALGAGFTWGSALIRF